MRHYLRFVCPVGDTATEILWMIGGACAQILYRQYIQTEDRKLTASYCEKSRDRFSVAAVRAAGSIGRQIFYG